MWLWLQSTDRNGATDLGADAGDRQRHEADDEHVLHEVGEVGHRVAPLVCLSGTKNLTTLLYHIIYLFLEMSIVIRDTLFSVNIRS